MNGNKKLFIFAFILIIINNGVLSRWFSSKDKELINEIKQILIPLLDIFENEQKTIPFSKEELEILIDEFSTHENDPECFESEECAINWLEEAQKLNQKVSERAAYLEFQFETNITDYNQNLLEEFAPAQGELSKKILKASKRFFKNSLDWDSSVRRMLSLISKDINIDDEIDLKNFTHISSELESIYAKGEVCKDDKCYSLEPNLTTLMATSRDYDELLWAWKGWAETTGPKMKDLYTQSIAIQNNAAKSYGYKDMSEYWMQDFETENFESLIDDIYEQLKPFYQQLHSYVRRKLRNFYGADKVKSKYIPAHLLGNMWAQSWDSIYDIVAPYPDITAPRVTESLKAKEYTPLKIFKESEKFFTSIGLFPMTSTFWKYSMITKPTDRDVQCHGSATSLSNGFDYRIKMCTEVAEDDFFVVHHEMGHIEYYMSYSIQPYFFQNSANSAFHEAIGDTIALSVFTSKHLKKVGILDKVDNSYESNINFLMNVALKKLSFLPFGYLIDKWRWNVFRGIITPDNYNKMWWKMRNEYQGVEAPIERNENDFDPGSKYHVPANVPYVRYFMSHIHQFQFYRALCKLAQHKGPLHTCDFYNSRASGEKLKEMLKLGSSKHWTYALNLLTGEETASMNAFIEYFQPLLEWLQIENSKYEDDQIGW